ncbi:MAG TPA: hypothetical protein VFP95_03715 [Gammaproteobacteria bacterium]|nr:hypothetical protein [Gammaproteobacteria bacterium]
MFTSLRQYRRSLATTLVVVFSAGWLSLAATPCFADAVLPDTPETQASTPLADTSHCPHCDDMIMPSAEDDAAAMMMECNGHDTRPATFFDLKNPCLAVLPTALQPVYPSAAAIQFPIVNLSVPPPDIPATERFCSYHE